MKAFVNTGNIQMEFNNILHMRLLKGRNKNESLLDSVYIYLQSLVSANCVERLFTFRHLDCLHDYCVMSQKRTGTYF